MPSPPPRIQRLGGERPGPRRPPPRPRRVVAAAAGAAGVAAGGTKLGLAPAKENGAAGGPIEGPAHEETMAEDDENPAEGPDEPAIDTLSPEARAAALAESGVLEGDDDLEASDGDLEGDEGDDEPAELAEGADESGGASEGRGERDEGDAARFAKAGNDVEDARGEGEGMEEQGAGQLEDEDEEEVVDREELAAQPAASAGAGAGAMPFEEGQAGRRRRRRRRRRGAGDSFGEETPLATEGALADTTTESEEGAALPSAEAGAGDAGGTAGAGEGDSSAGRRIMSPLDAAIEILRGQSPGRGMHVRQLADAGTRRRLVHGEPSEAWRVMRAALAAEPRERLRAGLRPRVRAAGSGLFALARRPPDLDLERAEHVFGEARRALRERTLAALELRLAELSPAAFEAIARVLLQREGFGPATFVKRVEGTIYLEALRGRGARPSRCLIALRSGNGAAGRRAIGELRAGIRARNQDEGVLLLAGRLAEDAIAEWKQPGPPWRSPMGRRWPRRVSGTAWGSSTPWSASTSSMRTSSPSCKKDSQRRRLSVAANWIWLGRQPFSRTASLQERLRQAILDGRRNEILLLCEHDPVITLGRRARPEHLLLRPDELAARGIEVCQATPGWRGDLSRSRAAGGLSDCPGPPGRGRTRAGHGRGRDRGAEAAGRRGRVAAHQPWGVGRGFQDLCLRGPGAARGLRARPRSQRQHGSERVFRHRALWAARCGCHVCGAATRRAGLAAAQPGRNGRQSGASPG